MRNTIADLIVDLGLSVGVCTALGGGGGREPEYKIGPHLGTYTRNTSIANNALWSIHSAELPPKWSSGITRTRCILTHARIYDVYTSHLTPTYAPAPSSAETGHVRPRTTGSSGTQLAGSTLGSSSTQASQKKKEEKAEGLRHARCEATKWCTYRHGNCCVYPDRHLIRHILYICSRYSKYVQQELVAGEPTCRVVCPPIQAWR